MQDFFALNKGLFREIASGGRETSRRAFSCEQGPFLVATNKADCRASKDRFGICLPNSSPTVTAATQRESRREILTTEP